MKLFLNLTTMCRHRPIGDVKDNFKIFWTVELDGDAGLVSHVGRFFP
jgi:hypothetical protein